MTIIAFSSLIVISCGSNTTPSKATSSDVVNTGGHAPAILLVTVIFGNPPAGGGPCIGKGICDAVATGEGKADGIRDTFQVSPTDSTILTMRFSMADLLQNQPDQAPYFTNPNHTYQFDGIYNLAIPLYAPLNLAPNAQITPGTQSIVTINGDNIIVSFKYSHN